MNHIPSKCPLCGGAVADGTTTFTVDLKIGVVVVRSVPALVCTQCGEDWIENHISIPPLASRHTLASRHARVEAPPRVADLSGFTRNQSIQQL